MKNALLQAKFAELENVTPALIGVKPKFQLDQSANQVPELTLEELQMSLRKFNSRGGTGTGGNWAPKMPAQSGLSPGRSLAWLGGAPTLPSTGDWSSTTLPASLPSQGNAGGLNTTPPKPLPGLPPGMRFESIICWIPQVG